jgi:hypothetical protein
MRQTIYIITTFILTIFLSGCNEFGDRQNPLYGKIFRNTSDIPELRNFTSMGGSVMEAGKTEKDDYRFGVGSYRDKNDFIVCIFEEFLKAEEKGKVKYKILDTINIGQVKETEYLTYCNCRQDTIWDSEIIALVIADHDNEFYERIIKAWRANTKTGKIEIIKNLKGINCSNEGYGADGCGEDENNESDEEQIDLTTDSLNQVKKTENTIKLDTNDTNE